MGKGGTMDTRFTHMQATPRIETLESRMLLDAASACFPGFEAIVASLGMAVEIQYTVDGYPYFLCDAPVEFNGVKVANVSSAETTRTDLIRSGGALGLELTGSGYIVGVWDAGHVLSTHQEFFDGLSSRVTIKNTGTAADHPTHIAGTIGASGVDEGALGMAPAVEIWSYALSFATNDLTELGNASSFIVASNHSYARGNNALCGWSIMIDEGDPEDPDDDFLYDFWFGDRGRWTEDEAFGRYEQRTAAIDGLLYENPYLLNLLSAWAAGNERIEEFQNLLEDDMYSAWYWVDPGGGWWTGVGMYYRPIDDPNAPAPGSDGNNGTGYDSLVPDHVAKNTLVVGAVDDSYEMTAFSSWGPTDDGRIKPDLVANGFDVYSPTAQGDDTYDEWAGTSMAAPNVTGTAVLLIEHHENLFEARPRSATTKGLLIHTAVDLVVEEENWGPDYSTGWGLVDAAAAAMFLSEAEAGNGTDFLSEATYDGTPQTIEIYSDGSEPLKATLVWTDPAGAFQPNVPQVCDRRTPVLVNDLDLWITGPGETSTFYYPWKLDPANPGYAATRPTDTEYDSDKLNHLDNVVQVMIDASAAGVYTVHVGHTGDSFTQDYSLLVSGASDPAFPHVDAMVINDDPGAQYSRSTLKIEIDFNENVNSPGSLDASDLLLYYHDGEDYAQVDTSEAVLGDYDSQTDTVTWDFTACSLPDGWYKAVLPAGSIYDGDGNGMGKDYVNLAEDLFVQGGDTNADKEVDLEDLWAVRNNFGGSGSPLSGDTDLDEDVDLDDLFTVRNNFGFQLGAAPETRGGGEQAMGGGGDGSQAAQLSSSLADGGGTLLLESTYATLTLSAEVTAAYDPDTWEEITPTPDHTTLLEETYWWRIDFSFDITDIPDGFQGFGGMSFDMDVSGFDDAIAWQADSTTWWQFPPGVQRPIWSDNGDYGTSSDFEGIVVAISSFSEHPNDPRGELGQGESRYVGSVYVLWDGLSQADLTLTANQMGLIDDAGVLVVDEEGTFTATGVTFGGGS